MAGARCRSRKCPSRRRPPASSCSKWRLPGICGTDGREYAHGPFQFPMPAESSWGPPGGLIPGHEFSGTVVAVGREVSGFNEGDLVASASGISCGACDWCRRGRTNLCLRYETVGLQRHGGLAQFCVAPAGSCAVVDQAVLSPDAAALGQPMAIAVHAVTRGEPSAGMEVLVVGAGGSGPSSSSLSCSRAPGYGSLKRMPIGAPRARPRRHARPSTP